MIICVEGIDGAGKNTLVRALIRAVEAAARDRGRSLTATSMSFPRYEESLHAQLAADALKGSMGDLIDSVHGMAVMFALDRHGVVDQLRAYAEDPNRLLILDRYVASNAAYTAARAGTLAAAEWVADLEFDRLGLPRPRLTILLDTPVSLAEERALRRESLDVSRTRDAYERDDSLQRDTAAAYRQLAERNWNGEWLCIEPELSPEVAAARIVSVLGVEE